MAARGPIYGVGINDAGYRVYNYKIADGSKSMFWICPIYRAWTNMLSRCYSAAKHLKFPTYAGCSTDPIWHRFSSFSAWMTSQDWEGMVLDKDILVAGNKIYGPDTCVFISGALNGFLLDSGANRGEWPIGVSWHKASGKFQAKCRNPFSLKEDYLGLFVSPEAAHEAWRSKKHEHACSYADMQSDRRIADALMIRYLKNKEA